VKVSVASEDDDESDSGSKAHRAGLATGVDLATGQREGIQASASGPDGDDLGMGSRVVG